VHAKYTFSDNITRKTNESFLLFVGGQAYITGESGTSGLLNRQIGDMRRANNGQPWFNNSSTITASSSDLVTLNATVYSHELHG
jgi:hypothetical protein